MRVYFLRHGEADWPDWDKPDDERPLTKKGRKEMERVAVFLRDLDPKISLMLSSPLPRALQTVEIVAEHLRVQLKKEPALAKGFDVEKLRAILKRENGADVMLVGHEPAFSEVIRELTGGKVKLSKGGVAAVELDDGASDGRLIWLISPKVAKA
jgi:phosphohistidine phosphatase